MAPDALRRPVKLRVDPRPLYIRAEEALAELIASHSAGDRLPTEPELARRLGISRATLREALRSFEERGQIARKPGVGTFVLGPRPVIDSGLEVLESIDTMAARLQLDIRMVGLTAAVRTAEPLEAEALQQEAGGPVIAITRNILTGQRPIAHFVDVLPADVLSESDLAGFRGSVLDLLLERGQPVLSHSRTALTADSAGGGLARQLNLQRGMPLLCLESILFTRHGRPIDYSHSYFVPGYFKFHVIRRVGRERGMKRTAPDSNSS